MAHPKSKTSSQRKKTRRAQYNLKAPNVSVCSKTGTPHLFHRAYEVDGNIYYRGKIFIENQK